MIEEGRRSDIEQRYEDVSPLTSDSGSDIDSDPIAKHARNSIELAEYDREVLQEEEEREKLLTAGDAQKPSRGFFHKSPREEERTTYRGQEKRARPRRQHKKRRAKQIGSHDEEGELMYEMEEGGRQSDTSSQASSSSIELDNLNLTHSSMSKVRENSPYHNSPKH